MQNEIQILRGYRDLNYGGHRFVDVCEVAPSAPGKESSLGRGPRARKNAWTALGDFERIVKKFLKVFEILLELKMMLVGCWPQRPARRMDLFLRGNPTRVDPNDPKGARVFLPIPQS
jgi:hypothetical protein